MTTRIEELWGGIPEIEGELMEVPENKMLQACNKKKSALRKLVKKADKRELREFKMAISNEIVTLVEEEDSLPLSEEKYIQAVSDVLFFFRECRSIVSEAIERELIERRIAIANSEAACRCAAASL